MAENLRKMLEEVMDRPRGAAAQQQAQQPTQPTRQPINSNMRLKFRNQPTMKQPATPVATPKIAPRYGNFLKG